VCIIAAESFARPRGDYLDVTEQHDVLPIRRRKGPVARERLSGVWPTIRVGNRGTPLFAFSPRLEGDVAGQRGRAQRRCQASCSSALAPRQDSPFRVGLLPGGWPTRRGLGGNVAGRAAGRSNIALATICLSVPALMASRHYVSWPLTPWRGGPTGCKPVGNVAGRAAGRSNIAWRPFA